MSVHDENNATVYICKYCKKYFTDHQPKEEIEKHKSGECLKVTTKSPLYIWDEKPKSYCRLCNKEDSNIYFKASGLCDECEEKHRKNNYRISWEEYALKLAFVAAERSIDPWLKVGCCLLRHDNSIAGLGYNGEPAGMTIDWTNRDERRKRVIHAETNATRYIKPGEVYLSATTIAPCSNCVKILKSYGITKIVYKDVYKEDTFGLELAKEFKMELVKLDIIL